MFGHHNDVITQDQKADASVPLDDSAIDALTSAPATSSTTDNPAPASDTPAVDEQSGEMLDETHEEQPPVPFTAAPGPQSFDGLMKQPAQDSAHTLPDHTYSSDHPVDEVEAHEDEHFLNDEEPVVTPFVAEHDEPELVEIEKPTQAVGHAKSSDDVLLKIKQEALQSLSPLIGQLDMQPEDKFRTIMMLIQASDNAELLGPAYEIAQTIEDEKNRAQALLDVVNEINYFTQNGPQQAENR